jgi:hypothetical protein
MKTIPWDHQPISKPGIYSGIDLDLYHAAGICDSPSLSSSGMRTLFDESPAHFYAHWRGNPEAPAQETSRALIIGSAVHHLILGEPNFAKLFAIQPPEYEGDHGEIKKWNNRATDCKLWHKRMVAEGRIVLLGSEINMIRGMAKSLGMHPLIRAGALNGQIERSIFWKDKETGLWLKSRPDTIPGDSGDFVDLKTTDSVQWRDLVRTIGKFGYHMQGALVRRAAREALGVENPTFSLVFVEKEPPHCVRVVTLKDKDLDRGEKQNRIAIDTFAFCLKAKRWPGPGGDREDAEPIELSDYEQKRIDEDLIIKGA